MPPSASSPSSLRHGSNSNNKRRNKCSPSLALLMFWLICTVGLLSTVVTLSVTLHLHHTDAHHPTTAAANNNDKNKNNLLLQQQQLYQNAMMLRTRQQTTTLSSSSSSVAAAGAADTTTTTTDTSSVNNVVVTDDDNEETSIDQLRARLAPSIWTVAGKTSDPAVTQLVAAQLVDTEKQKATQLCGKFLYSTLQRAVQVGDMGESTFVATGDIDDMWTRVRVCVSYVCIQYSRKYFLCFVC